MYRFIALLSFLSVFSAANADELSLKETELMILKVTISTPEQTGAESIKKDDAPKDVQKALLEAIFKTSNVKPYIDVAEKKFEKAIEMAKKASEFHLGNRVEVDCKKFRTGPADQKLCSFKATRRYGWYADPFLVEEVSGFVLESKTK